MCLQHDGKTGELIPLVIAGGGGGNSFHIGNNPVHADGGLANLGNGFTAGTPSKGPGMQPSTRVSNRGNSVLDL